MLNKKKRLKQKICPVYKDLILSNRIGKFTISNALIKISLHEVRSKILSEVFVIKAQFLYNKNCMEYVGYSELFSKVPLEEEVPSYLFIVSSEGSVTVKNLDLISSL